MTNETCMVCGKQPVISAPARSHWFSYIGYGVAYLAVISPILFVAGLFPMKAEAADSHSSGKLCHMCAWTFGAFAFVVLAIALAITWLAMTTHGA